MWYIVLLDGWGCGTCPACRFVVPKEVQPLFLANWREREQDMQRHPGFVDFELKQDGDSFVISSRCANRRLQTNSRQSLSHPDTAEQLVS